MTHFSKYGRNLAFGVFFIFLHSKVYGMEEEEKDDRLAACPIATLPTECVVHIFGYLIDVEDLKRASLVSKGWRKVLNRDHIYQKMTESIGHEFDILSSKFEEGPGEDFLDKALPETLKAIERVLGRNLDDIFNPKEGEPSPNATKKAKKKKEKRRGCCALS